MEELAVGRLTFNAPPVSEVALSVQFKATNGIAASHIGGFWQSVLKADFPKVTNTVPVAPIGNEFSNPGIPFQGPMSLDFPDVLLNIRHQFSSDDNEWLVQIQQDRFILNWRKREAPYPRFPIILERFLKLYKELSSYLSGIGCGTLVQSAWDLLYVNNVPKGELWKSPLDWPHVFPGLWGSDSFRTTDNALMLGYFGKWVWEMPSEQGHLHIDVKPGRQHAENPTAEDCLLLTLNARGPCTGSLEPPADSEQFYMRLKAGNEFLVKMFDVIASKQAKVLWGRVNE